MNFMQVDCWSAGGPAPQNRELFEALQASVSGIAGACRHRIGSPYI